MRLRASFWPDCAAAPPHHSHSQTPKGCDRYLQSNNHSCQTFPLSYSVGCCVNSFLQPSVRPSALEKNKTRPSARPYLTGSSADWTCEILKKIRAVQSSWPAARHLQPPADQLPDWLAVCVSRGPEWQTSIQPEAGTAGYQATPLTHQLTCCLAAGMDGWLWMLLAACLGFFYSMAL